MGNIKTSGNEAITELLGNIQERQVAVGMSGGAAARAFVGIGITLFIRDVIKNEFSNAAYGFVNGMVDPSGIYESQTGRKPTEWKKHEKVWM